MHFNVITLFHFCTLFTNIVFFFLSLLVMQNTTKITKNIIDNSTRKSANTPIPITVPKIVGPKLKQLSYIE